LPAGPNHRRRLGERDFSRFEAEPGDRLLRSIEYVNLSAYGGAEAPLVGKRLRAAHESFRGVNADGSRYHALEPEAYAWVHATLADGIVAGQAMLGSPLDAEETERARITGLGYLRWRRRAIDRGALGSFLPAESAR
jgi:uncharacterized protein (DUF2236 family)